MTNKSNQVLELIKENPNGIGFRKIADILRINFKELQTILSFLIKDDSIFYRKKDDSYFLKNNDEVVGIFKDTRKDFGFVETELESYFIPSKFRLNALEGDTVKIKQLPSRPGEDNKGKVGKVIRVLKRNGSNIIGTIKEIDGKINFIPDENYLKYEHTLINPEGYKDGEVVIAKFFDFKNNVVFFKIISKISEKREDRFDWLVIANKYNLLLEFSPQAIQEAKDCFKKIDNNQRKDFTKDLIVTIDGVDSKDLDDAVSIKKLNNGNFLIGVHIADVSFFLQEETELDFQAYQRATSVYLIDKVVPMLPVQLSNDLCSLNPDTEKKTLSAEIEIDNKGNIVDIKTWQSKIVSKFRLTYKECDEFFSSKGTFLRNDKNLSEMILMMQEASQILRKKKLEEGMIDFKLPETKVELDQTGKVEKIYIKHQTESEKIIEDFMVLANQSIAILFQENHLKSLFRTHEQPSLDSLQEYALMLKTFGIDLKKPIEKIENKDLMGIINLIEGKPYEFILKRNLIQLMEKAKYTSQDSGHYALGIENYLHFTSPIRRYPDVIVHRTLRKYILEKKSVLPNAFSKLDQDGKWCTEKEINAMHAERKLVDIKKAKYFEGQIGNTFQGVIASMTSFGIFVELDDLVSGMILVEDLNNLIDVPYDFKTKKLKLNNGKTLIVGEKIKVKIISIDKIKGNIALLPIY